MFILTFKRCCFITLIVLAAMQVLIAQEKPKVFLSDDFFLESSPPAYLWFYDQKGILDKPHRVDGAAIEIVKAFAKNCECTVLNEPNDADYVVVMSHHDLVFGPKLGEKKFAVIKVEGEKLVVKGSVRRTSNIVSDSCKAILKDWKPPAVHAVSNK